MLACIYVRPKCIKRMQNYSIYLEISRCSELFDMDALYFWPYVCLHLSINKKWGNGDKARLSTFPICVR